MKALQPYTTAKLSESLERTKHPLSLDDIPDVLELDGFALEIAGRFGGEQKPDRVALGDRLYVRPTFLRAGFINLCKGRFMRSTLEPAMILFALDASHDRSDLAKIPDRRTLRQYMAGVDATADELEAFLIEISESADEGAANEPEPTDEHKICATLAREVGGSVNDWMDASDTQIISAISAVNEAYEREAEASGKSKKVTPPKATAKMFAIKRFHEKLRAMEAAWLAT